MGLRRRRSSSWRAAPAVGHSRRETKPCPHASSGREGPVRIPANEGDGTDELPENVGFQRHSRAQLSANSNAMCESFFATLECELLARTHFDTHEQARHEIFSFIEGWYNTARIHSSLKYRSPLAYEQLHAAKTATLSTCGLPTAAQRHGRTTRRPAVDNPQHHLNWRSANGLKFNCRTVRESGVSPKRTTTPNRVPALPSRLPFSLRETMCTRNHAYVH
ncbi:hypothetical protein OKW30_008355 [Paraburkholderia sp. Clong3]